MWENSTTNLEHLPELELQSFFKIEQKYRWLLLIQTFLFFTILVAAFSIAESFIEYEFSEEYIDIAYYAILFLLVFSVGWIYLSFPKRAFLLRAHDLSYKSGLLVKKITSVPKNRIQHVEIRQGVFLRMFNLSKIVVYTAGGSGSDLSISGLKPEIAEQIKEDLSQSIYKEKKENAESV